jgi:hypothetical protein
MSCLILDVVNLHHWLLAIQEKEKYLNLVYAMLSIGTAGIMR